MTPTEAITDLKSKGLTEAAIAAKVGSSQPTISKIARGLMQPNWRLGQSIVDLARAPAPKRKRA